MAELGLDVILRWPQPATGWSGAWVPSQRLRLGHCGESTRSLQGRYYYFSHFTDQKTVSTERQSDLLK